MGKHFTDSNRPKRLLTTLEGLLAIQATDVKSALTAASQLVAEALNADKVDVFLYHPSSDTLVAEGTSDTPMGRKQRALGLHRLPLSNGGTAAIVFQTGEPYASGHVDEDPNELRGIKDGLGVRSVLGVPLVVDGVRRGVLGADSANADHFRSDDLEFLGAVARWIGMLQHRTELATRVAQQAAQEARQVAVDEMVAILAHDLSAPLVPVRGYLGMILNEATAAGHENYRIYVHGAQRGISRLLRMIDNLLDAARLEQGIFVLQPTPVDIMALAHETATLLHTPEQPVEVHVAGSVVVECDPDRIRQALENLISNALQYSPAGSPVRVNGTCEQREDGTWAVLTVKDRGPGIPPDLLPKLFTRFARGKSRKGLGLGLYLAHGIARAHQGSLTVESTLGNGATFRMALPIPKDLC